MDTTMPPTATKRLFHTTTYRLHFDDDPEYKLDPRYAILSHRWLDKEITYTTLNGAGFWHDRMESPQLKKVQGACAKARQQNIKWLWMDSICINKANAVEDATAINSMFKWYRQAAVCYTYLSDVLAPGKAGSFEPRPSTFQREDQSGKESEWFHRGWTLQELLAPKRMEFFDKDWRFIGTKTSLAQTLASITGINARYLTGDLNFRTASIAAKMSWMAGRRTSKPEDIAWSMLGIFGITTLSPSYSLGMKAFVELEKELIRVSTDETIFAWTTPASGLPATDHPAGDWGADEWGLLAPSPECFKDSGDIVPDGGVHPRVLGGYKIEQQGLMFPFPSKDFAPGHKLALGLILPLIGIPIVIGLARHYAHRKEFALTLNCLRRDVAGRVNPVQVYLRRLAHGGDERSLVFRRERCSELGLAPKRPSSRNYKSDTLRMIVLQPEPED